MKTNSIIAFACTITLMACGNGNKAATDGHNAENSLDYEGTYYGFLPAADCPGINVTLTLNKDKSFTIINDYVERSSYTEKSRKRTTALSIKSERTRCKCLTGKRT